MPTRFKPERSVDAARTIAFSDGVFAVAITLLVVQIGVPSPHAPSDTIGEFIGDAVPELASYFVAFALIGLFWYLHHIFFDQLTAIDGRLIALNLAFLSLIALMPFPTAIMGDHPGSAPGVAFFAGTIAAAGLLSTVMLWSALDRGLLPPEMVARKRRLVLQDLITPMVFVVSVPIALVAPRVAPWIWLGVAIVPRVLRRLGVIERF